MIGLRRTKIVVTLGPATDDPAVFDRMVQEGADVARINASHGTQADHLRRLEQVRAAAKRADRSIGVLMDLGGPKIRIEGFRDGPVRLEEGRPFTLDTALAPKAGTVDEVGVAYQDLPKDVSAGDALLLADGHIVLDVVAVKVTRIECRVRLGGELSDRKGLNRQGGGISAPALSDKDKDDIRFGAEQRIDYIAVSFARDAADISRARAVERSAGGAALIVAKIERQEAITNLAGIV